MFKAFFQGPFFSVMRRTAFLWLYYACIPIAIGICQLLRRLLFPGLPAAIAVIIVDVILILATRHIHLIWRIRTVVFPKEELPYVRPLFALIPIQLVFVCVSMVIVFL